MEDAMKYYFYLFLLILGFGGQYTYSGTIDPGTSDAQYIKYGEEFEYVGRLCGTYKDDSRFCASAVAIDDHFILTAAHVVKDSNSCLFTLKDKTYCITDVIYHKDFDDGKFGTADIAIGYSKEPFGLKFYPALYEGEDEANKICCMSGFGITGNFISGAIFSDNKQRAGSNTIDHIDGNLLICSPSRRGDKDYTTLEFLIASGDSGGGLFIDGKLAGINSCVMAVDRSPKSVYKDESGHTRVSRFINWIREYKNAKR
jgi:hypothetical protein